jgi:hypothetical protein
MIGNAELAVFILQIGAGNVILLNIRVIKECRLHPRLAFVSGTLENAWGDLAPFFMVFFAFLLAMGYAGIFIYGEDNPNFANLFSAMLTMWNMLLGDFDADAMHIDSDHMFNITWFWVFFIFGVYLLLNMVLAIVMDAYAEVKADMQHSSDIPSAAEDYRTLLYFFRRYFCCCYGNRRFYGELADLVVAADLEVIRDQYAGQTNDESIKKYVDAIDTDEYCEVPMDEQLENVREFIAKGKLEAFGMLNMNEQSATQLCNRLLIWQSRFEGGEDDLPTPPTEILAEVMMRSRSADDECMHLPGEQKYTVEEVATLLKVGDSEAELLFKATEDDMEDDIEFEEDRQPKMRDLARLETLVMQVVGSGPQTHSMTRRLLGVVDEHGLVMQEEALLQKAESDLRRVAVLLKISIAEFKTPGTNALLRHVDQAIAAAASTMGKATQQASDERELQETFDSTRLCDGGDM